MKTLGTIGWFVIFLVSCMLSAVCLGWVFAPGDYMLRAIGYIGVPIFYGVAAIGWAWMALHVLDRLLRRV